MGDFRPCPRTRSALDTVRGWDDSLGMDEQWGDGDSRRGDPGVEIEFLDRILQGLFGLGLKLEYCLSVLDDSPAQARVGLEGVVSGFDELTEPIRDEITRLGRSRKLSR
jgi:hypothetical protein